MVVSLPPESGDSDGITPNKENEAMPLSRTNRAMLQSALAHARDCQRDVNQSKALDRASRASRLHPKIDAIVEALTAVMELDDEERAEAATPAPVRQAQ